MLRSSGHIPLSRIPSTCGTATRRWLVGRRITIQAAYSLMTPVASSGLHGSWTTATMMPPSIPESWEARATPGSAGPAYSTTIPITTNSGRVRPHPRGFPLAVRPPAILMRPSASGAFSINGMIKWDGGASNYIFKAGTSGGRSDDNTDQFRLRMINPGSANPTLISGCRMATALRQRQERSPPFRPAIGIILP